MKGGRKNLKRATGEEALTLQDGHSIMQVVSLRGSNLIEVIDAEGGKSLAILPAKFRKSMWMKRGSFVIIDGKGRDKALESGSKVACTISQVLYDKQVRVLQKSAKWPEAFKTAIAEDPSTSQEPISETVEEMNSSDDDGFPPLEANLNRVRPAEFCSDSESEAPEVMVETLWAFSTMRLSRSKPMPVTQLRSPSCIPFRSCVHEFLRLPA